MSLQPPHAVIPQLLIARVRWQPVAAALYTFLIKAAVLQTVLRVIGDIGEEGVRTAKREREREGVERGLLSS